MEPESPLTAPGEPAVPGRRHRPRTPWVIALVVALLLAGVGVALARSFSSGGAGGGGVGNNANATGRYTLTRQDLSSQTQVSATLGYAGSYTIAAPSGASASQITQAQQAVTQDQQALSADEQAESDASSADAQVVAADQTNVNTDQTTLSSDQATQSKDCAGSGASGAACSQDTQKVGQDQTQLTQAQQQLDSAKSTATRDHDQDQARVQSDQTKLQGDQAALTSLQATEVNPGTTYTWLPNVGDVIKEDQPVYSLSNEPVLLLYGSIPAYRALFSGMSDGLDVGQLTQDLVALGYGDGLAQSDHFSSSTASAVERWQSALGLPATGEILLGEVVFEPGPIRVTSVTASLGSTVGGGGSVGSGGAGAGAAGGVLSATSTTRQVSIALDASEQSEVAVGDKVTITLPNNETTSGVISSVGTVATSSSSGTGGSSNGNSGSGSSGPTITVLVNPTDPAATGTWDQAQVNVTITTGTVTNVLVVPVDALLAQTGGGYAVEVVGANGIHHLVAVTVGLFDDADGLVQVSGSGLSAGQQIVAPKI